MTGTRVTTSLSTESLELAAYMTAAGYWPPFTCPPGWTRAVFTFKVSDELYSVILQYEQGAQLRAKRLLNRRSWLFRMATQAVQKRGRHEAQTP